MGGQVALDVFLGHCLVLGVSCLRREAHKVFERKVRHGKQEQQRKEAPFRGYGRPHSCEHDAVSPWVVATPREATRHSEAASPALGKRMDEKALWVATGFIWRGQLRQRFALGVAKNFS